MPDIEGETEFKRRARIRIEHWLEHNEGHLREYEKFAAQLEESRAEQSAAHIRRMAALTLAANHCLREALAALGDAGG